MGLEDKLKNLNSATKPKIDWEKNKLEFLSSVDSLYKEIESWLSPYIDKGYMSLSKVSKLIAEEYIGEYEATKLEYSINKYALIFEPMGRNIIGGKARIDLYLRGFKSEKYLLILLEKEDKSDYWVLIPNNDKSKKVDFNKESLEIIIESMIDRSLY